ncbi:MAG: 23S rRNA (uracil(1939)-C(5))-methyltransferase RlmD [Clostridium sp.]|nr:23S rRNA (uracil(1939)-C(5))-methyltransferase RlmD [Clostridium sp.]
MKNIVPVVKNESYKMNIDSMGNEGEGIGKVDNFTVFVKDALAGETVQVKITKVNKNFAFGKLEKIYVESQNRVKPVCSIYSRCGGCNLQHLNYESQLLYKKNKVKDCIERIGKIDINSIKICDTIKMENPYRYRNKVQLPVGIENGKSIIGFFSSRSHNIIPMEKCYIQDEVGDKVAKLIRQWIDKYNIPVYNEKTGSGLIRHIIVRKAFKTKDVMVVVVANGNKLIYSDELVDLLTQNISEIKSIIQNVNNKKTNVILGKKCITLWGKDEIADNIGRFKFNISPLSFFQVNPVQMEILYKKVLEYAQLTGNETVFDAYCGTGTISLFLSEKAKKVYGVEIIEDAIENAKINAAQNHVDNAEFIVGKSECVIPELINKGVKADVVVVDPPRKGCDEELLKAISDMACDRIIYVSCNPATLARDIGILDNLGYETCEVQPVDMFPMTAHVETVILMTYCGFGAKNGQKLD